MKSQQANTKMVSVFWEPFSSSRFNDWWPLHYYLGVAYEMTGRRS